MYPSMVSAGLMPPTLIITRLDEIIYSAFLLNALRLGCRIVVTHLMAGPGFAGRNAAEPRLLAVTETLPT